MVVTSAQTAAHLLKLVLRQTLPHPLSVERRIGNAPAALFGFGSDFRRIGDGDLEPEVVGERSEGLPGVWC